MGFSLPPNIFGNPLMRQLGMKEAEYMSKGAIGAIRLRMDEYAREIFDLWFEGKAPPVVTFENERWENYMRAEPRVVPQVTTQLEQHAKSLQSAANPGYVFVVARMSSTTTPGTTSPSAPATPSPPSTPS